MKIAIFDYLITSTNPAGSCHRSLLTALADEYEFTVFSHALDPPVRQKVNWVRVPVICRPLAVLFLTFHMSALLRYCAARFRRSRFALIQSVESNLAFADVVYSHFCHRWFLRHRWRDCRVSGLRGVLRWLDHALRAMAEPWALRRARWIVVPSTGLMRELKSEYPFTSHKISVIPNPIDVKSFQRPPDFDAQRARSELKIGSNQLMMVFIALGHFERKGLPLLLEAVASVPNSPWKLIVVGGTRAMVSDYEKRSAALGLTDRVHFVGYQQNIRPFLWASDLFAMPTHYESFFLAAFEAAAAQCPVLTTSVNGVEECLNSSNAFIVTPDVKAIVDALNHFQRQTSLEREAATSRAFRAVSAYGLEEFAGAWRAFYRKIGQ